MRSILFWIMTDSYFIDLSKLHQEITKGRNYNYQDRGHRN